LSRSSKAGGKGLAKPLLSDNDSDVDSDEDDGPSCCSRCCTFIKKNFALIILLAINTVIVVSAAALALAPVVSNQVLQCRRLLG
jgi:hypothetical protein